MYSIPNLAVKLDEALAKDEVIIGKRVIIRACLNVPTDSTGKITDTTRLDEALPEIQRIANLAQSLVILGHMGRPDGQPKSEFSFHSVQKYLEAKLGFSLGFLTEIAEPLTQKVNLVENIRFNPEEESKDAAIRLAFAQKLATWGDVYVNDAFPDYREAASTYELAQILPAYLGKTFAAEVTALSQFSNPNRPFVAVLGGAKLSEKIDVLNSLGKVADKIIIGGAMAYTLLKSQGVSIGKSLVEEGKLEIAKEIMTNFGEKILLPFDHLVLSEFKEPATSDQYQLIADQSIPDGVVAVDIGSKTSEIYTNVLKTARSILWNGPLGVFEWEGAAQGTQKVANAIVSNPDSYKLAGGGDSLAAIAKFGLTGFNHVSTGGGAMLAFLAYTKFPTLDVIINRAVLNDSI